MSQKKNRTRNLLTAALLALMVATNAGCASNGYYPNSSAGGTYGSNGSWGKEGNSPTRPDYYYSDPSFCNGNAGLCPLLLGAAVVGIAAIAAH